MENIFTAQVIGRRVHQIKESEKGGSIPAAAQVLCFEC